MDIINQMKKKHMQSWNILFKLHYIFIFWFVSSIDHSRMSTYVIVLIVSAGLAFLAICIWLLWMLKKKLKGKILKKSRIIIKISSRLDQDMSFLLLNFTLHFCQQLPQLQCRQIMNYKFMIWAEVKSKQQIFLDLVTLF